MHESEADVPAGMAFPPRHRPELHSRNPPDRLNKEVKRRADVVGIFPDEDSIMRLIGAVLLDVLSARSVDHPGALTTEHLPCAKQHRAGHHQFRLHAKKAHGLKAHVWT